MMRIDHIAVAAEALEHGVPALEAALGLPLEPGGAHALMGTHNRLLSLGPAEYLELIAIDPAAARPAHPRWFGLDQFAGRPRPAAWACAVDDLDAAAEALPGSGRGLALARGDFVWRMAVPPDGMLPFDGLQPALIEWEGAAHPAPRLPDRGVRLLALVVRHPRARVLAGRLEGRLDDPRVRFETAAPGLSVTLATPAGEVVLE